MCIAFVGIVTNKLRSRIVGDIIVPVNAAESGAWQPSEMTPELVDDNTNRGVVMKIAVYEPEALPICRNNDTLPSIAAERLPFVV